MRSFFLLAILCSTQFFAQTKNEIILDNRITDVTVFLQSAQIGRSGKTRIPSGESIITMENLSPYMDDKSIQVKANGNFTVLSVKHKLDYLSEREENEETENFQNKIQELNTKIEIKQARLEVLAEKESLLDRNKNLNGESTGASLAELKQAIEFYDKELSQIKKDHIETEREVQELIEQRNKIKQQISDIRNQEKLPSGKIEIRVESEQTVQGEFQISYMVGNAGWYPNYDLRVENIEKPLSLEYKADVYQNTGIDWNNVKLKFSNGNPNQSGVAPELETWYLNYPRNRNRQISVYDRFNPEVKSVEGTVVDKEGLPLPGVNILVKGSTVGTQTDFDGKYELTLPNNAEYLVYSFVGMETKELPIAKSRMNVILKNDASSLDEVVVTALGIERNPKSLNYSVNSKSQNEANRIQTTTVENQTTVDFEVDEIYSVPSNGERLTVDLKQFEIPTAYEYYSVPKLEKAAFLLANVTKWEQYNLLEGEANLFFENSYVGRTILDAKSLKDTLSISLGRDRNIVIGREKIDEFSKRKFIGSNTIETREFRIIAKNKKSQPIILNVYDQIPVAAISEIDVDHKELSKGILNEKTGEIKWNLNLESQEQKDIILKYEVKYPREEDIILE